MPRHGKGSRQKVAAAKGQTYGDRVAQEEAQRVVAEYSAFPPEWAKP